MKRRKFIRNSTLTAISISAFGSLHWNGKSFEGDTVTTSDILGPFYRPGSPMRSNLVPPGSKADVIFLKGTMFQDDGRTPLPDVRIESWQCDEHEQYDNKSDEYLLRGTQKTDANGQYEFKTIVPPPYNTGERWRPAHIHLRISSDHYQDLITQIYFKGDPYIKTDIPAASPEAINRILEIKNNSSNEKEIKFDVVMAKSFPLNDLGYQKITGLYQLKSGMAEFIRQDDLLILKLNGQILEGLVYKGNNSFEGGGGYNRAKFEFLKNGDVMTKITLWDFRPIDPTSPELYEGLKVLKYGQ